MNAATESANRQSEMLETSMMKMRHLEEERTSLEAKIHKLEAELTSCELTKESLRRDKQTVIIKNVVYRENVRRDIAANRVFHKYFSTNFI